MQIALNPSNKELFSNPARYYYSVGGRWSGKTYDTIQAILYRLLVVPESRACLMRKVYASIKDSLYADTVAICKSLRIEHTAIKSPLEIRLPNGSIIIFKGADDPEKIKGLANVDIVLMEEANEFISTDFETIDQSIRGDHQENSIYLCHNPVPKVTGSLYWFETQFRVNKEAGKPKVYYDDKLGSTVATMRSTYKQNLKCPEHVKRRLEGYKDTNPDLYKLWALGLYTEIQGAVFKNWDIVDSVPEGLNEPGYGLDFGFSNDPAALVRVWHNSTDIWIEGLIYLTSLTNQELYDLMVKKDVNKNDRIIADSAEPKSIHDLYNRGLRAIKGVKKRPNYKADIVQVVQGYSIHLVKSDINLEREFSVYSWQRDKTGRQLPKLQDGDDHFIDAFLMYCSDVMRKQPSRVSRNVGRIF